MQLRKDCFCENRIFMKCICQNPTTIVNPSLMYIVNDIHYFFLNGDCYHPSKTDLFYLSCDFKHFRSRFSKLLKDRIDLNLPWCNGLSFDYSNYKVYFNDGRCLPLFIEVPCGKCPACREKKYKEWRFRGVCESNMYDSFPYFLTLTFSPVYLPKFGLSKRDLQLFFKRVRKKLDTMNIQHNIRYIACGEYGKKGRAHYHVVFYNFPDIGTLHDVLRFFEDCWSFGFVYVKRCDDPKGSVGYVCKYMRKDCLVPEGMNPTFFLSSRRNGGIGSQFIKSKSDFFLRNLDLRQISVTDKFSGKVFSCPISGYIKSLIMPSISKIVDKSVRENVYNLYMYVLNNMVLCQRLGTTYNIPGKVYDVFERYSFLRLSLSEIDIDLITKSRFCCDTSLRGDIEDEFFSNVLKIDSLVFSLLEYICDKPIDYLKSFVDKIFQVDYYNSLIQRDVTFDVDEYCKHLIDRNRNEFYKRYLD